MTKTKRTVELQVKQISKNLKKNFQNWSMKYTEFYCIKDFSGAIDRRTLIYHLIKEKFS